MVLKRLPEPQHRLRLPCSLLGIEGRQHLGRWFPGRPCDRETPLLIAAKPPEHMLVDNMARKAQPGGLVGNLGLRQGDASASMPASSNSPRGTSWPGRLKRLQAQRW